MRTRQHNTATQNKINHVTFLLDRSGSMNIRKADVVNVTESLVKFLAARSKEVDQETRITVYLFDTDFECVIYDKDVLRMPSIAGLYKIGDMTNLVGTTIQALNDAAEIPQRYGDHAYLFYVITDGQNNIQNGLASRLRDKIEKAPENYTLACLVPDLFAAAQAQTFGFPPANIQQWDTNKSFEEVGQTLIRSTEAYFVARSKGIRGTKSLFSLDTGHLSAVTVQSSLDVLSPSLYHLFPVRTGVAIQPFVEGWTGYNTYRKGGAYYQLTKPETVQNYKQVALRRKLDGNVYVGPQARQLLGLPDYEVKVSPASHPDYDIFVQSTSVNRKLVAGTLLLVLK